MYFLKREGIFESDWYLTHFPIHIPNLINKFICVWNRSFRFSILDNFSFFFVFYIIYKYIIFINKLIELRTNQINIIKYLQNIYYKYIKLCSITKDKTNIQSIVSLNTHIENNLKQHQYTLNNKENLYDGSKDSSTSLIIFHTLVHIHIYIPYTKRTGPRTRSHVIDPPVKDISRSIKQIILPRCRRLMLN